jgi:hypothetical protein
VATFVALSVIVTEAPGTTAPAGSVTVPLIVACVESWAISAGLAKSNAKMKTGAVDTKRRSMNIFLLLLSLILSLRLPLESAENLGGFLAS